MKTRITYLNNIGTTLGIAVLMLFALYWDLLAYYIFLFLGA